MKKLTLILTPILILAAAGALCAQTVTVNPTSLSFSALVGGTVQSAPLAISTSNGGPVIASSNFPWLKINNSGSLEASTPATLSITADPTGLVASSYGATITLNAVGIAAGSGRRLTVPVTFAVGIIGVSAGVVFLFVPGGRHSAESAERDADRGADHGVYGVARLYRLQLADGAAGGTAPGTLALTPNASALPAAGTYACTVTITPTNAPPVPITATLTVTPAPTVTAGPSPVSLAYQIGGATGATNAASQTLTLANPSTQALSYFISPFVSSGTNWLSVNPSQGTIPAAGNVQVTVSYLTSTSLAANAYQGTLAIFVPNAANPQINVPVNLVVSNQPLLTLPGATVAFMYQAGGSAPAAQNVLATTTAVAANAPSSQQMTMLLTATATGNWLVVPQTAQTGTAFAVSVNASVLSGLQPGNYTGTISVVGIGSANATAAAPLTIPVTLKVTNDPLVSADFRRLHRRAGERSDLPDELRVRGGAEQSGLADRDGERQQRRGADRGAHRDYEHAGGLRHQLAGVGAGGLRQQ